MDKVVVDIGGGKRANCFLCGTSASVKREARTPWCIRFAEGPNVSRHRGCDGRWVATGTKKWAVLVFPVNEYEGKPTWSLRGG